MITLKLSNQHKKIHQALGITCLMMTDRYSASPKALYLTEWEWYINSNLIESNSAHLYSFWIEQIET
jgi:hypothetical protein